MSDTQAEMNKSALLGRYVIVMLLTLVAVTAFMYVLETYTNFESGSGMSMVAAIIPAMDAGTNFAKTTGRRPHRGQAWRLSALMLLTNVVVGIVVMVALNIFLGGGGAVFAMFQSIGFGLAGALFLGVMAVYLLITRLFFGIGAKSELRRKARLANNGQ